MSFSFLHPQWLYLLPLLGLLGWRWRGMRAVQRRPLVLLHPRLEPLPAAAARAPARRRLGWWLTVLAWSLLLVALARPQTVGDWIPMEPQGREVVLLVDVSQSMGISDFRYESHRVARLDVLKGVVSRFVEARPADHFALVAFASRAATVVPMSPDRELVVTMLQRLRLGLLGDDTAIGDALALAVKQLRPGAAPRPVVILFSDGDNTAGDVRPAEALALARQLGVALYTVAVSGSVQEAAAPEAPEEEPGLQTLAELTGGRHYAAHSPANLDAIVRDIDRLEQTIRPPSTERQRHEWYLWPLLGAIGLLVLARLEALRQAPL